MIALAMIDVFRQFLNDPGGILPADAISRALSPHDNATEAQPGLGYLDDAALPDDPARACVIGVIDDALPFAHERLRWGPATSRVAAYWAQDAARDPAAPIGGDLPSGLELRGQMIDALLARLGTAAVPDEDGLYRRAGVVDFRRPLRQSAAYESGHGAAVIGLAAGFAATDPRGRDHPVIAVSLPARISEDSMGVLAPIYMLAAIMYVITRARRLCRFIEVRRGLPAGSVKLPVVVNISFGLSAGPRDGSTLLERFLDAVSGTKAPDLGPIRFVLPIGNHRQARLVGRMRRGQSLDWRIQPDDLTASAIEIWGPRQSSRPATPFAVGLAAPGMAPVPTAFTAHGQMSILRDPAGRDIARAYYQQVRAEGGRWREGIVILAMPTCPVGLAEAYAPSGDWRLAIAADAPPGPYEISVQRDETISGFHREARQSRLEDPHYRHREANGRPIALDPPAATGPAVKVRRKGTLSAYGGGKRSIRAGSAQHRPLGPSVYSGLLRGGNSGDVQALVDRSGSVRGVGVAGRDSGAARTSTGTSLAAPQVARWLAGRLAEGRRPAGRNAVMALARQSALTGPGLVPILPRPGQLPDF